MAVSSLVLKILNVVPRPVEHSAAPAAKACSGEDEARNKRLKESAIGKAMLVMVTAAERTALAFKAETLV